MKTFGFRIGDVGLEFSNVADRDKAIAIFTHSSQVVIRNYEGQVYETADCKFSTYERDTKENIVRCGICSGLHTTDGCAKRKVWVHSAYRTPNWRQDEKWCCDACSAKATKDKELADAKELLEKNKGE